MKQVALTKEQIESLAHDDNSTVYEHTYDRHEPVANSNVRSYVKQIVRLTRTKHNKEEVLQHIQEDETLRSFQTTHPTTHHISISIA